MPFFREFQVSKTALQQAIDAGLKGSVEATLKDMARRSAIFTREAAQRGIPANRRFNEWWLHIVPEDGTENGIVTAVGLIEAPSAPAPSLPGLLDTQDTRTAEQKRIDKARVESAIKKHFPRK